MENLSLICCSAGLSYTGGRGTITEIPRLSEKNVFFRLKDSAMGSSVKEKIDVVVQIDARAYYEYPYALKTTGGGSSPVR